MQTIYLAGGCFWGIEKLMQSVPGVVKTVSGYANGDPAITPTYELVSTGKTGYRETVKVVYDPDNISLAGILSVFFRAVDPTVRNRQGNDCGSQYQTGIYFTDPVSERIVRQAAAVEQRRNPAFHVEIQSLRVFHPAEEYHQNYLEIHPDGYCHISPAAFALAKQLRIDPGKYPRPGNAEIRRRLRPQEYAVTQDGATDPPGFHPLTKEMRRGIYVDVVTGEPLFTSADKYLSTCGWPAFSAAVDPNVIITRDDNSHGMYRTEIRSRSGDSHLGHVFSGDTASPTGIRFCVNGSALRFVPYEEMDAAGYGYLKDTV